MSEHRDPPGPVGDPSLVGAVPEAPAPTANPAENTVELRFFSAETAAVALTPELPATSGVRARLTALVMNRVRPLYLGVGSGAAVVLVLATWLLAGNGPAEAVANRPGRPPAPATVPSAPAPPRPAAPAPVEAVAASKPATPPARVKRAKAKKRKATVSRTRATKRHVAVRTTARTR